jgi:adenosylhomocysteine nucleosidase
VKRRQFFRISCLLAFILCSSCNFVTHSSSEKVRTAILGAFDEEIVLLKEQLKETREHNFEGITFYTGVLGERNIVVAEAGVGKVNAAMTVTLLIEHFRPNEVIFTGIAGSTNPEILPGDIVIGEKSAQHDRGQAAPGGFEILGTIDPQNKSRNPVFFPADEKLLQAAVAASETVQLGQIDTQNGSRRPKTVKGVIVTGDCFVASDVFRSMLREKFNADAVEMEGAAVAQICYQQQVPCIVIRSISDNADERAAADVEKFYKIAAKNSAALVAEMVNCLAAESDAKR